MPKQSLEYERDNPSCPIFNDTQIGDHGTRLLLESVTDYAIYMLDPQGRVVTWNAGAERLKGYVQEEVLGRDFSIFFTPEAIAAGLPKKELDLAARDGRFETYDWRIRKKGERFWALVTLTAIRKRNGELDGFAKVTRDMTSQKLLQESQEKLATELEDRVKERTWQLQTKNEELRVKTEEIQGLLAKIRKDLGEKELLLREVHHRVKNNLQVVKSLLSMGARTVGACEGRDAIEAAAHRIQVIATAHERLYQVPDLARLKLATYVSEIVEGAVAAHANPTTPVQLTMEFDEISLPLDLAIPMGLLVNELVSNCMKHGFSQSHAGTIWLSARIVPGAVHFVVHDNGKGLPENFNTSKSRSMGLRLADSLAHQLGGRLAFSSNDGCRVEADLKRLSPTRDS
jgi:PAS domain S-box-containing protein